MSRGIFVIGTDTEVGKTVVAAGLLYLLLKKQYRSAYFKPVASGQVQAGGVSVSADAAFIQAVSGFREDERNMTPFAFKNAVAPHLAARLEGKPIVVDRIREKFSYMKSRYDWIIAEGAGGLAVPLNDDGYMQYDLIRDLGFSCLLVSRTGLGTINHTLLTLRFAESLGIKVNGIIMNGDRHSDMERDNLETLKKLAGGPAFFVIPAVSGVDTERLQMGNLREVMEATIPIETIVGLMDVL